MNLRCLLGHRIVWSSFDNGNTVAGTCQRRNCAHIEYWYGKCRLTPDQYHIMNEGCIGEIMLGVRVGR